MSVTITMGSPNRWRRWSPAARPAPGSWFYAARPHHSGTWKLDLDYRPIDGVMPEFWHQPFIWRPAPEIEAAAAALSEEGGLATLTQLPADSSMIDAHALATYVQAAKLSKKLLFGSAYGLGAKGHTIKGTTGELQALDEAAGMPFSPTYLTNIVSTPGSPIPDKQYTLIGKAKFGLYNAHGVKWGQSHFVDKNDLPAWIHKIVNEATGETVYEKPYWQGKKPVYTLHDVAGNEIGYITDLKSCGSLPPWVAAVKDPDGKLVYSVKATAEVPKDWSSAGNL